MSTPASNVVQLAQTPAPYSARRGRRAGVPPDPRAVARGAPVVAAGMRERLAAQWAFELAHLDELRAQRASIEALLAAVELHVYRAAVSAAALRARMDRIGQPDGGGQ